MANDDIYLYISKDVKKYWSFTEAFMADIIRLAPEVTTEMAKAYEGALHNLRMIISTVNFENISKEVGDEPDPYYENCIPDPGK